MANIAETSPSGDYIKSFVSSFSSASVGVAGVSFSIKKRPQFTFSEKLLESLNLIERDESQWLSTAIGESFITSVSEPA